MEELFQIWATPAVPIATPVQPGPGLTLKNVRVRPRDSSAFDAVLLELEVQDRASDGSVEPHFRQLGVILSRLSFLLLTPFRVFSARVVQKGLTTGSTVTETAFAGEPPGIATDVQRFGFQVQVHLDQTFLTSDLPKEVEVAIGWLVTAHSTNDPVQQVMCSWIGLEALAPLVSGPWSCQQCEQTMAQCPHCNHPTSGPKAVQTVRRFLREQLGVSRKEYMSLYGLRCRIAHGALPMDPDGVSEAYQQVLRIQQLLLEAIKLRLDWPKNRPPLLQANGMTIFSAPGLILESTISMQDFYEQPGVPQG